MTLAREYLQRGDEESGLSIEPPLGGAIDSHHLAAELAVLLNHSIDASGEANEVTVSRAYDDAGMTRRLLMESNKVPAIQRDHGSPLACCDTKHFVIGKSQPAMPAFLNRDDIMPQSPQLLGRRPREVLVDVQLSHEKKGDRLTSGGFVDANLLLDLRRMCVPVRPRLHQILGP